MDFILAKLEGFIDRPDSILQKYHDKNDQMSNYKKSIAFFRSGYVKKSIELIDLIIKQEKPSDCGFLYETKGQILFENGDIEDSIIAYNQAIKLLDPNDSALIKITFASAILALKKDDVDLIKLAMIAVQDWIEQNHMQTRMLLQVHDELIFEGTLYLLYLHILML
jgi:tetratricopeptide (TPR) repeat protein